MKKGKPWIVLGGRVGEIAHCKRSGQGLSLGSSQSIAVTCGALEGFQKDHENCKTDSGYVPEAITRENWMRSRDAGTSSFTIYSVMRGMDSPHGRYAPPQDPDDFGRCHRLLKLFPEWEPRLSEVVARFQEWSGLVRAWSNLATMYESSLDGDRSKLCCAIQDLLKEGGAA